MPARKGHLGAVLEYEDVAHQVDDPGVLDVLEIDDAVPPGAEKLGPVEPFFTIPKRPADKHRGANPVNPAIVSLGFQAQKIRHAKDTALDVVGQDDKVVIFQRLVAVELVKNFPSVGLNAHLFRVHVDPRPAFCRIGQLFGRAETFSIIFRLHGVIKAYLQSQMPSRDTDGVGLPMDSEAWCCRSDRENLQRGGGIVSLAQFSNTGRR